MKWLVILLLIPVVFSYYTSDQLVLENEISNTLHLVPNDNDYSLKFASAELTFYPRKDYRQEVLSIESFPEAKATDSAYIFSWEGETFEMPFLIRSRVRTTSGIIQVKDKLQFPLQEPVLTEYVQETSTVDFKDDRIEGLASNLAKGEDDLYVVTHKFASWVNKNINYNLNSVTAHASQKASWVIENREGVCDELTNLFIALCRAVGIPARFVTGVAYTNVETFENPWSPHGWAEVYFPGTGWVPFDVTYGEFGYIDPAHIKLKDALDANRSGTRYEWQGYNIDIRSDSLNIQTDVIDSIGTAKKLLELKASLLKENTGFGSYDAVVVEVKNPHDYYIPTEITLSRSEGVNVFDDYNQYVLMEPDSSKKLFWIFKLQPGQQRDYVYNYTFAAFSARNSTSSASLISNQNFKTYTLDEIRSLIDNQEEEEQKVLSRNLDIGCQSDPVYYVGETAQVTCTLRNTGNVVLMDIEVCLDSCQKTDLGIGQSMEIVFDKLLETDGAKDFMLTAKNDEISKSASIRLDVWDKPDILFEELMFPETVRLSDNFTVEFTLKARTSSIPKNLHVTLATDTFERVWNADELSKPRKYILNVENYLMSGSRNPFTIYVTYTDLEGHEYSAKREFTVLLKDLTLKDKVILLANRLNTYLERDVVIMIIGAIIAGLVVRLIFWPRKR